MPRAAALLAAARPHLAPALAGALLCAGALAWAPASTARAQQAGPAWEYRTIAWTEADLSALLRTVTAMPLASDEEMAHSLQRGNEPVDDPRVQAAVDATLEAKLDAAGAEGWEAFAVVPTKAVVHGVLLPAPRAYLRRRA